MTTTSGGNKVHLAYRVNIPVGIVGGALLGLRNGGEHGIGGALGGMVIGGLLGVPVGAIVGALVKGIRKIVIGALIAGGLTLCLLLMTGAMEGPVPKWIIAAAALFGGFVGFWSSVVDD